MSCPCYECSSKRKAQRAAWEKTPKAKARQKAYRKRQQAVRNEPDLHWHKDAAGNPCACIEPEHDNAPVIKKAEKAGRKA